MSDFGNTVENFLKEDANMVTTGHLTIGEEHTVIPVTPVTENIFSTGDNCVIFNLLTGSRHNLVVGANYTALDENLIVEPFTPVDPLAETIPPGSPIFMTRGQIKSSFILLDNAIALKVGVGEVGSSLTLELTGITVGGDIIKSDNYVPGVSGWAIKGDGTAEFQNVISRGTFRTAVTGQRAVLDSATNRLDFYGSDNNVKVRIGEAVQQTGEQQSPGLYLNEAILHQRRVFTSSGTSGAYMTGAPGGKSSSTLLGRYDAGADILYGLDVRATGSNTYSAFFVGTVWIFTGGLRMNNLRIREVGDATTATDALNRQTADGRYMRPVVTVPSATPYAVESTDYILLVRPGATAFTVNLPAATEGRQLVIKDDDGSAGTGNITINRNGTDTIDGATSYTINTNRGSVWLVGKSGGWAILAEK
jgi:hypothetical protein